MARVHIHNQFRSLTGGLAVVEVEAATVKALVAELDRRYPGMGEALAGVTAVAIDDEVIRNADYEAVPDGAEIHFLTAPSGG